MFFFVLKLYDEGGGRRVCVIGCVEIIEFWFFFIL